MDKIKSQCCKCSHSIEIHYALSQADGYDPKKSRVSDDTLADFFRSQLTGKDHLVAAAAAADAAAAAARFTWRRRPQSK